MRIMLHICYYGPAGAARSFAGEMIHSGIVDRIRSLPGNIQYDYFSHLTDEKSVLLISEWQDRTYLKAYYESEEMKELCALCNKYDLHMHMDKYMSDATISKESLQLIRRYVIETIDSESRK